MRNDTLNTLLRLREAELDEARRAVTETLAAEQAARTAVIAAEQEIQHETRVAAAAPDDGAVERFAVWLKRGRNRLRLAETALAEAQAATANKRAEWQLARAASEAVAAALARRADEARAKELAAEQHAMDDHAGRSAGLRLLDG